MSNKKYICRVYLSTFYDVEVEADNEKEAKELAESSENWTFCEENTALQEGSTEILDEYDNIPPRRIKPDWDNDGEDDLPKVVEIPGYVDDDDVADYISDIYGFLMFSWEEVK